MTAISVTILQFLTISISTAIVFFSTTKWQKTWGMIAGSLLAFFIAWPMGITIWSVLFPQHSWHESLPEAMTKSFWMVAAGSAIGIYTGKRHAKPSASNMNERKWTKLSLQEARAHNLYGTRGWLIVFAAGLILGLLQTIGSLRIAAYEASTTLYQLLAINHPGIDFIKMMFGVQAFVATLIIVLMAIKHSYFRMIATTALLSSWPAVAVIGFFHQFQGQGTILFQGFITWIVSCGIWVTYLQKSKRVRVTFEHTILDQEKPKNKEQTINHTQTAKSIQTGLGSMPNTGKPTIQSINATHSSESPSEEFWEKALMEFDGNQRRLGLWAKLFAEANGVNEAAKAAYLKQRATEMHTEAAKIAQVNSSHDSFKTQLMIAQSYLQKQESNLADREMAWAILKSLSAQGCQEAEALLRNMENRQTLN